ncbi:putative 2-oxoglutarate dependent dioxygenase PhnY [Xenorhabdus bovienii str. puntauvense]|uniref:Putative 2-oxoglutarate dependent dioxygenase PhnY n=1 Tax=Xenorhabdus bovienii str. puntauvense TaxID=1398201 RepID=A0A077NEL4_XENBV|nr:phytanoyl-CoA dioxygenase family protein [Xenorhabdus bovienii]CDG97299.1 putative 2-oxoglutarate dependent dioxygenase PhnY [Xenorhabdus bovienii str. puntauvense]
MNNEYKITLNKNGYILIKNFLCDEEKKSLNIDIEFLYNKKDIPGKIMKYYEESVIDSKKILNRIENFIDYKEIDHINKIEKKVSKLLSIITEKKHILFKDKINFKLSGGGGFLPHQDHPAFTRFIKEEIFNIMIPVDDMNIANGCLYISKILFKKKSIPHNSGQALKSSYKNYHWIPIQAKCGDLLIFSSFLLHMSKDNLSNKNRRCIFFTYNSISEGELRNKYFEFKRKIFPPIVERNNLDDHSNWKKNLAKKII